METCRPTMSLRWKQKSMNDIGFCPGAIHIHETAIAYGLQQWWESDFTGESGEWRDIKVEEPCDKHTTG